MSGVNPPAVIIVGTNGTGKTTDALRLARKPFRTLYFTAQFPASKNHAKWYKEGGVFFVSPTNDIKENERIIGEMADTHPDTCICIDDARLWVGGSSRVGVFIARLFARRRHIKQPIIYVCHSISQIPTEVLDYDFDVLIKKTTGQVTEARRKKWPEDFWGKVRKVNNHKNPFHGHLYKRS